ncbi:Conserved_hypothetical protein [Hexamita inflata]|uniref:Uncharacterized protein n=1 Tax=Hexamita inflata TaxID=28002 RepID=A0ABP1GF61_9EUKA
MTGFKALVEMFEKTFQFGTVAFKCGSGMVTTSRGHKSGAVFVQNVDFEAAQITADDKATLNAPLLFKILLQNDCDFVLHRHEVLEGVETVPYEFPGTVQEVLLAQKLLNVNQINIQYHGFVKKCKFTQIDWKKYYIQFPERYFRVPTQIQEKLQQYKDKETVEVGSNTKCEAKYSLDPYVKLPNSISYADLETKRFDLIVMKNSIAYLTEKELKSLQNALNPNGEIIANSFMNVFELKTTENEVALCQNGVVNHLLKVGDEVVKHEFYGYSEATLIYSDSYKLHQNGI